VKSNAEKSNNNGFCKIDGYVLTGVAFASYFLPSEEVGANLSQRDKSQRLNF